MFGTVDHNYMQSAPSAVDEQQESVRAHRSFNISAGGAGSVAPHIFYFLNNKRPEREEPKPAEDSPLFPFMEPRDGAANICILHA